jgi:hypothetical protein
MDQSASSALHDILHVGGFALTIAFVVSVRLLLKAVARAVARPTIEDHPGDDYDSWEKTQQRGKDTVQ